MDFKEVIQNRYSCKKFGDRPVDADALTAVLEAGRLAPTAKNAQEQRVYVLRAPETLAAFDGVCPCRYGAPVVLVVAYAANGAFVYPGGARDSGAEDAAIVATHMMLAAANEGLDSCWINFFDPKKLAAALGLPEGEEIVMALDLGHAAEGFKPLPPHFGRKALSETVVYL